MECFGDPPPPQKKPHDLNLTKFLCKSVKQVFYCANVFLNFGKNFLSISIFGKIITTNMCILCLNTNFFLYSNMISAVSPEYVPVFSCWTQSDNKKTESSVRHKLKSNDGISKTYDRVKVLSFHSVSIYKQVCFLSWT